MKKLLSFLKKLFFWKKELEKKKSKTSIEKLETKKDYPVHYTFDDEGRKTKKTIYIPKNYKLMLNITYNKWENPKKYKGFPIIDFVQVHSADDEDGDRWSPIVDFGSCKK